MSGFIVFELKYLGHFFLFSFSQQEDDHNYWVSGRSEEEARKNAAERFKVSEDKISLKQGMGISELVLLKLQVHFEFLIQFIS